MLTAAQNFLGSPGTKGAVDRISEAAISVKKLADDVDSRVKGYRERPQPLHQYGPARIRGARR